ncbi:MAG: hypothetical protein QM619_01675 [Micropruina sp.]|uniref:hypothetical protein n=1 Tax=Micropruina sp. TaxID=2737536 RepID=UPI0039E231DA
MAETRKYRPSSSLVGDAVRAALGESVRPIAPGGRPDPTPTEKSEPENPAPAVTVRTFTFGATRRPADPADPTEAAE